MSPDQTPEVPAAKPRHRPPIKKKGSRNRQDWPIIKRSYVEGTPGEAGVTWPTLNDVAAAHGVSDKLVRERAAAEGWRAERDLFQAKLEQVTREKRTTVLAARAADFDSRTLNVAEAIVQQVAVHLKKSADAKTPLKLDDLRKMGGTVRNAQFVGRLAMGDVTEYTKNTDTVEEFDLSVLTDEELALFEAIRRKIGG